MSAHTGRFAPSPTGRLHVGNLRTALLAWLFARSEDAPFLLRIEDLDRERSRPEHEAQQIADLRAIGIDWDGEHLMRQSERTAIYRAALDGLIEADRTYPCWCSRAEIRAAASAPHADDLPEGAYPGTCRRLTAAERAERERSSERPPSIRLAGEAETVSFEDRLHGTVSGTIDDFVLWRWDGTPAYNLAVVVDDAEQRIGEVVRADDLLESTPRHLHVARLLGLPTPAYAHVPLVLGPDGQRLAKRHGAVTLEDVAPAAAVAWMADSLGLGEATTAADLLPRFDPAALPREPTVHPGTA